MSDTAAGTVGGPVRILIAEDDADHRFLTVRALRDLRGVDIAIRRNEYVAIMGPSGSGKTTLLSMLGALLRPSTGEIRLNGQRVVKPSARVRVGDTLTLTTGREVLVVRVLGLGDRRGPAAEARSLYEVVGENA